MKYKIIQVPVSPEFGEQLAKEAKSEGLALAAYIRRLLLTNKIRLTDQPTPTFN